MKQEEEQDVTLNNDLKDAEDAGDATGAEEAPDLPAKAGESVPRSPTPPPPIRTPVKATDMTLAYCLPACNTHVFNVVACPPRTFD